MIPRFLLLVMCGLMIATTSGAKTVHVAIEWTFDQKGSSWTSKNTGISLRQKIADFRQTRAEPVQKSGRAVFGYSSAHGVITLFIEHRLGAGFAGTDDCTPAARDSYLREMRDLYGKTDSEQSFALQYSSGGKRGRGVGTLCHFLSFPKPGEPPAYSEVGVILTGEFLLLYRGSFVDKTGIAELNRFLAALGVKKV